MSQENLLLPPWLKWLLGFSLPSILIGIGTLILFNIQLKTEMIGVKRDIARYGTIAVGAADDIEEHLLPRERLPHPLMDKDIRNIEKKIEELSK